MVNAPETTKPQTGALFLEELALLIIEQQACFLVEQASDQALCV